MSLIKKKKSFKTIGLRIWEIVRFVIIFGLAFLILKPFVNKILLAFMNPDDLLDPMVMLIPKHFSVYYWRVAWQGMELSRTLLTSTVLSIAVSLIQMISSALIGYGLGRFKFRGRNFFYAMVIIIMLIPPQAYSIAQYLGFRFFGIGPVTINTIDSLIPVFIMAIGGIGMKQGLYIYLFVVFFKGLPKDLENAAYIDGAGAFRTFFSVIMPNAVSIIVTVMLFSFAWQWTDLSYPKLYFTSLKVIPTVIGEIYVRVGLTPDTIGSSIAQNAACMLLLLPLLVLFIFGQKFISQSISRTGQAN